MFDAIYHINTAQTCNYTILNEIFTVNNLNGRFLLNWRSSQNCKKIDMSKTRVPL